MEHKMGKDTCINIIFDSRHTPQDYGRLLGEFIEQGITHYKFWDAVVLKDSVVDSIAASHKMIVQDAKDRGLKECCIMEQDAAFTSPNAWKFFLENKPNITICICGEVLQFHCQIKSCVDFSCILFLKNFMTHF